MNCESADVSSELEAYRHGDCAFFPDSLGLHVEAPRDAVPFNKPDMRGQPLFLPLHGRFAHEEDHLFRSIGTSWGLMCHVLQGRVLHHYLEILGAEDLRERLTSSSFSALFAQARRLDADAPELGRGDSLLCRVQVLSREIDLRRALMGALPFGSMRRLSETVRRLWGIQAMPDSVDLLFPRPRNRQYPNQFISAASVMESLGILKESMYAVTYGEADDGEIVSGAATDYSFALSYARALLADRFHWDTQPIELEAALGLALWPPLVPGGLAGGAPIEWRDIEPGTRLCRLLEWLEARGTPLTAHDDLGPQDRDRIVRAFIEVACARFGWANPNELARQWHDHLQESTAWSRSRFQWWCLGERRLRTRYSALMLDRFVREPYGVWFPTATNDVEMRPTFSYFAYDDIIEVPHQHSDTNGRTLSARLESYVFLGMRYLLRGAVSSRADREIVDQHLRLIPQLIEPGPARERAVPRGLGPYPRHAPGGDPLPDHGWRRRAHRHRRALRPRHRARRCRRTVPGAHRSGHGQQ